MLAKFQSYSPNSNSIGYPFTEESFEIAFLPILVNITDLMKNSDAQGIIEAGRQLGQLNSFAEIEQVFIEFGDTSQLLQLRALKSNGQWNNSDTGLLMLELTENILIRRGLFTSYKFIKIVKDSDLRQPMSRKASCWDNAS